MTAGAALPLSPSGFHLLAALWVLLLLAALSARRLQQGMRARPPLLLTRQALRHPPLRLPPSLKMRAELKTLLSSPAPAAGSPESAEHALRRVLERCLQQHDAGAVETLARPALVELWLLAALLRAAPERAGALAQCFRAPHRVLALRDRMPAARPGAAPPRASRLSLIPRPGRGGPELSA